MDRIVNNGMKLDLHIHSCFSAKKDGKKVKNNTIENISVLVQKLNENNVNICAITDHDVFSYQMYSLLKAEEKNDGTIEKVLPGVEFSVLFKNKENEEKVIHIVTVFDDRDENRVKIIEDVIKENPPKNGTAFTEEEFLKVLRIIDIDTILIAHQKNSLSSDKARLNDANTLGKEQFLEFVYTDYFEAFEFKNKRNEILNRNFLAENNIGELSFVTGTDCHDWSIYPKENKSDNADSFPYTYAKCLPTFRGLVMAMTDHNRLKRLDSFFSVGKIYLDNIEIKHQGRNIKIPLSKGINVIIGDNSVGKSLLLHAITGYKKSGVSLSKSVENGYKNYIKKMDLEIKKQLNDADVFRFDMQGEVRKQFEENLLNSSEFLSRNFPKDINTSQYTTKIFSEIERLIEFLKEKFELADEVKKLSKFKLYFNEGQAESLTFTKNIGTAKQKSDKSQKIIEHIININNEIDRILTLELDKDDIEYFKLRKKEIADIQTKYAQRVKSIEKENNYIETISSTIEKIKKEHNKSISDNQKGIQAFESSSENLVEILSNILKRQNDIGEFAVNLKEEKIVENSNRVHDYKFISKVSISHIGKSYFENLVKSVFKARTQIDWCKITKEKLKSSLLGYDETTDVLDFFKTALQTKVNDDFKSKKTIIKQGMDKSEELSAGLNTKIFFDLLSYETTLDGIYIIDQPEDNVSQPAIKSYLLDCFKNMAENRQIIMVTHNPQFIVNLDIDNLIYLSKDDKTFVIRSGALEYECPEYKILEIVANNIEGGLDSIQKRWKRYEKVANPKM